MCQIESKTNNIVKKLLFLVFTFGAVTQTFAQNAIKESFFRTYQPDVEQYTADYIRWKFSNDEVFDKKQRLTDHYYFESDSTPVIHKTYKYNKKDQPVRIQYFNPSGALVNEWKLKEDKKLRTETKYWFAYKTKTIDTSNVPWENKEVTFKNQLGLDSVSTIYAKEGGRVFYYTFQYDTFGLLIDKQKYLDNNRLVFHYQYTYDHLKRLLTADKKGKNNTPITKIFYYYVNNENDLPLREETVFPDNTSDVLEYEYKYDGLGNWIEKKVILNGEITEINIRTLTYHGKDNKFLDVK